MMKKGVSCSQIANDEYRYVLTSFDFVISAADILMLVLGDVLYIMSKIFHAGRETREELEQKDE